MTKGNTVKKKRCLQHATKWHHIPHNQSMGHSQDGREGEGGGVNWSI